MADQQSDKEERAPIKMRCQKAMWWGDGTPAGVCSEPAYGPEAHMRDRHEYWTAAGIARCPRHGGPTLKEFQQWLTTQLA